MEGRAHWRQQYTPDELDCLHNLISACTNAGVEFVYALSPGIDIQYSNTKDVNKLKNKFTQVRSVGCSAFALLFDDIEHAMCEADKLMFGTFASAQVAVTNQVYEYLQCPNTFLFCPTEYCESRAMPSLENSQYLDTLGRKLLPKVHILWTGPRVISRVLSAVHCERVSAVLRRPVLIWDNLHANDYDPRRVYLGPYTGRPMQAKQHMSGVLTNPNCEFEANFVAIATLAHWANCDAETELNKVTSVSDAQLEAGGAAAVARVDMKDQHAADTGHSDNATTHLHVYHPLESLRLATLYWARTLQGNVQQSLPFSSLASYAATVSTTTASTMLQLDSATSTVSTPCTTPATATHTGIQNNYPAPPLVERELNQQQNDADVHMMQSLNKSNTCETSSTSADNNNEQANNASTELASLVNTQTFNSFSTGFTQSTVNIVQPTNIDTIGTNVDTISTNSDQPGSTVTNSSNSSTALNTCTTRSNSTISNTSSAMCIAGSDVPNVLSSITPYSSVLVSATALPKHITDTHNTSVDAQTLQKCLSEQEPMDTAPNNNVADSSSSSSVGVLVDRMVSQQATLIRPSCLQAAHSTDSLTMLVDCDIAAPAITNNTSASTDQYTVPDQPRSSYSNPNAESDSTNQHQRTSLSVDSLALLVDLFYLPFEHGATARMLIGEFTWLKQNARALNMADALHNAHLSREWYRRCVWVQSTCTDVETLYLDIVTLCTSSFLVDFYPYVFEMQQILSIMNAHLMWLQTKPLLPTHEAATAVLESKQPSQSASQQPPARQSVMSRAESTGSLNNEELEPWVYRGGLIADLHELVLDERTAQDLFTLRPPYAPLCRVLRCRPATLHDMNAIQSVCVRSLECCCEPDAFNECPALLPEIMVGSLTTESLSNSFVIEESSSSSETRVVACVLVCAQEHVFTQTHSQSVMSTYSNLTQIDEVTVDENEHTVHTNSHNEQLQLLTPRMLLSAVLAGDWPAAAPPTNSDGHGTMCMRLYVQQEYRESPAPKMLMASVLAALVANNYGSVYCDSLLVNKPQQELLAQFNFQIDSDNSNFGESMPLMRMIRTI